MSGDSENIACERRLSFRIVEMDDRSVVLDQVYFLDAGNIVNCELLQSRLKFLVVSGGGLVHDLLLATRCTLKDKQTFMRCAFVAVMEFQFIQFHIADGKKFAWEILIRFSRNFRRYRWVLCSNFIPFPPIRTSSAWACNFFNLSGFISLAFCDSFTSSNLVLEVFQERKEPHCKIPRTHSVNLKIWKPLQS